MNQVTDKDRLINTFLSLMQIDSPSNNKEKLGDFLLGEFTHKDILTSQDAVENIIAACFEDNHSEPLLFCAHMDIVGNPSYLLQTKNKWIIQNMSGYIKFLLGH